MPHDPLNLSMFRAYDIRTPASALTRPLAQRLARAEAVYVRDVLNAAGIVVAHDARSTGPQYLSLAVEVFLEAGLDVVYLPGVSSTCGFYYAAMRHPRHAAIMFGASHNPAGDTGQKIVGPGVEPIAEGIGPEGGLDKIKELYLAEARSPAAAGGSIRPCEILNDYVAYSMQLAGVEAGGLAGMRVLHDYLFGAAGREMMVAFHRAGAELVPLHFAPDGAFPLGDPNPVKQKVIAEGLAALAGGRFALATFFDGDGDRVDFYGGDGRYLASSFVYAAVLPEIRREHGGDGLGVFADLKANPLAVIEMGRTGVAVDVIRNGHSQIKEALRGDPTRFGAVEESAHFYQAFEIEGRRFCSENTLYFALLAARVWRERPERMAELLDLQATTARQREWGYKFPSDAQRDDALAAVREHFLARGASALERMDNGMDLDATLLRRGLGLHVDASTRLADDWLQVCQRVSHSEDGLARWEAVGATADLVAEAKREVAAIVPRFGAGAEYQG